VEGFFLLKLNLLLWEDIGLMDLEVLYFFIEQVTSLPSLQLSSYSQKEQPCKATYSNDKYLRHKVRNIL